MCGFNKIVQQRTLQTSQWPLFEICFPGNSFPVSKTCHGPLALLIFQRVIFFPLGVFEIACLYTQTPYVEWFEGCHPSGNSSDRSSVVGPCHGRLKKKKAWKLHPRRRSVVILPISFLKLNHLVWHVLRFNFVYINVNLLEKQLSTVYFKDVRFPWITLYKYWLVIVASKTMK